jgi:FkbM family methyltransferase
VTPQPTRAPLVLRLCAAVLRRLPRVRGRGRLELLLHRALAGHGWRELVRTNGYQLEVLLDDLIGRTVYLNGQFEPANTTTAAALLAPGAVVFDVGAHCGYYSLLFSGRVGTSGSVHAFEPVPETAARLRGNLARNPTLGASVRVWEVALSDREGQVRLNVAGAANTGASHVAAAVEVEDRGRREAGIARTVEVACQTGDSIWRQLGSPEVSLVKIDVEGHELHVLRGMRSLLSAGPCTVLAEVRDRFLRGSGGTREELFDLLAALGYASYERAPRGPCFVENPTPRDAELVVFSRRAL